MGKGMKRIGICLLLAGFVWCGGLILDRNTLSEELIRLHVVANSDSAEDQQVKLLVRDAVIGSIREDLEKLTDVDAAKSYLRENLPKIRQAADSVLEQAGVDGHAAVTLCREAFDTRYYDTFAIPSGVYESLRVVIGEGKGHNWWCVSFPSLCDPTTPEEFADTAAGAGFSDQLSDTLTGEKSCEVRFFLLDKLGQLENIFFAG